VDCGPRRTPLPHWRRSSPSATRWVPRRRRSAAAPWRRCRAPAEAPWRSDRSPPVRSTARRRASRPPSSRSRRRTATWPWHRGRRHRPPCRPHYYRRSVTRDHCYRGGLTIEAPEARASDRDWPRYIHVGFWSWKGVKSLEPFIIRRVCRIVATRSFNLLRELW